MNMNLQIEWHSYFGARYYDPNISIWLSVDPLADNAPGLTPYHYVSNNPMIRIDPDGRWDIELNETGNAVRYIAQKGDNLESLSIQLGVSLEDLKSYEGQAFEVGKTYSFDDVEKVKSINSALGSMNTSEHNCSNFALAVNGIAQNAAFGNGNDGVDVMIEAAILLNTQYSNISENSSSIGDIVTFGYSEKEMRRSAPHQDVAELYTSKYTDKPSHYGVVALKSRDGRNVSRILEKPGSGSARINSYPNYHSNVHVPRPQTGGISPFYRRK